MQRLENPRLQVGDVSPNRRLVLAALAGATCASWAAEAQTLPPNLHALMKEGRYLPIYTAALDGPDKPQLPANQVAAFVGDEKTALVSAGEQTPALADLDAATAEDAFVAIRRMARGRRLVILNESHSASRHRLFLAQLVRLLRQDGFGHLAAETFSNSAASAALVEELVPGSQVDFRHGTYLMDPVFAETVREAIGLGYRMVPYEQRLEQRVTGGGIAEREQAQAENLAAALRRSPDGRFIVYVGYSHLRETPDAKGNRWFAERLKALTSEDPLTVTQASTGSFGPYGPDGPLTRQVLERFKPRRSMTVTLEGRSLSADTWAADLAVFHAAKPYRHGRPGWLADDVLRRHTKVRLPPRSFGRMFLVQAVHAADRDPAIPADQCLGVEGKRDYALYLRPGTYQIRIETLAGFEHVRFATVR